METKKQTAVDQLRDRLLKEFGFAYSDNIHEELKAIERDQIIEAYRDGRTDQQTRVPKFYNRSSAIYYISTFGS
jgi:hypothetical protein